MAQTLVDGQNDLYIGLLQQLDRTKDDIVAIKEGEDLDQSIALKLYKRELEDAALTMATKYIIARNERSDAADHVLAQEISELNDQEAATHATTANEQQEEMDNLTARLGNISHTEGDDTVMASI